MFTRTTGFFIVPLWLAAMSWLVAHDVWPGLSAQDPPTLKVTDWLREHGTRAQLTIMDGQKRIGTVWTTYLIDDTTIRRDDVIWIERLPVDLAPLRVIVESIFTSDGVLDEFEIRLDSADTRMRLKGERFPMDFAFTFETGPVFKSFKVPLNDGSLIAGAFNPFAQLSDLHVGQTWRMQVFNPIAAVTGLGNRFTSMVVSVTGEERIDTGVWEGNCLVVEAKGAKAWIDVNGVAQLQEMEFPILGSIRIIRRPDFDKAARQHARQHRFLNR